MGTTLKMSPQMKENVDYILKNTNSEVRSNLNISKRPTGGYYYIVCKFYGINIQDKTPFEYDVIEIVFLSIKQNFVKDYTDSISLRIGLTPTDALTLYDNSRELKCLIQLFPYTLNDSLKDWSKKKEDTPLLSKRYIALFKNKEDQRKVIPKKILVPSSIDTVTAETASNFIEQEFTLIDELAYRVRKSSVNFQQRDATVTDIILQGCSLMGIKKISMVPADNKTVYQNVIIPPYQKFEEFFQYVNEFFGIYNQGYNFYITNETLFIYPVYDTESKSPKVSHFYNAGNNTYIGAPVLYAIDDDKNYHVVINTPVIVKNLQDDSPENIGTHFICQDADQIIDHTATMSEATTTDNARLGLGKMEVKSTKTYQLSSGKDDVGSVFNAFNPVYTFDWNNKYKCRNILESMHGSFITFQWNNAVPFAFLPGYRIQYHYDSETDERLQDAFYSDNNRYATKVGSCFTCTFIIKVAQREGKDLIYYCQSDIALFVKQEDLLQKENAATASRSNPDKGVVRDTSSKFNIF